MSLADLTFIICSGDTGRNDNGSDIDRGLFFADGPWGRKLFTVEGVPVSLDDAEHRILRPIWQDPRIHYAVNCASIGCPDLWPEAYESFNTDRILDQAAVNFINSDRGVKIEGGRMTVSKIYEWYDEDLACRTGSH